MKIEWNKDNKASSVAINKGDKMDLNLDSVAVYNYVSESNIYSLTLEWDSKGLGYFLANLALFLVGEETSSKMFLTAPESKLLLEWKLILR